MLKNITFINMANINKNDIISKTYYDKSGYGSITTTYKDAKQKEQSITLNDVKEWFQKNIEQKKQLRGKHSFIAPHPYFEFQLDLFFINDIPNQKFKVGMVLIDIFTRYSTVIPIKSKQPPDILAGVMEGMQKMKGKPEIIYSDEEGSLYNKTVEDYFKEEGIELYRTRGHPNFAERFIRTYKDMLYKRVEKDEKEGKDNIQWIDYNFEILLTYNNKMEHSSIGMTPAEALKEKNNYKVKMKMATEATRTRKYPEINIGDEVKIYRKKAITEKERSSNWLPAKYKVERIEKKLGQTYFYLEHNTRPFLRFEILKV